MRRAVLALMAGVTVFAVTSAAASSINVAGPFNPVAGSGISTTCDLGQVDVFWADNIEHTAWVNLQITTEFSNAKAGNTCAGASLWVKVAYSNPDGVYYVKITANENYTTVPAALKFSENPADGHVYSDIDLHSSHWVQTPPDRTVIPGSTSFLITKSTPTTM